MTSRSLSFVFALTSLAACQPGTMGVQATPAVRTEFGCDDSTLAEGPLPELLSQTGYFDADVESYEPLAALWSDGAHKRRFVRLPCDQSIDTVDIDNWRFPKGTLLWKEFAVGGERVETRVLKKTGDTEDAWDMSAYRWNSEGQDAVLVREGGFNEEQNWPIPDQTTCLECHGNLPGRVIGFSALQLGHEGAGVTLTSLIAAGRLTAPPQRTEALVHNWAQPAQKALLALHASCGHCHGAGGMGAEYTATETTPGLSLRIGFDDVDVAHSGALLTAVNVALTTPLDGDVVLRITAGDPGRSGLFHRMTNRGDWMQMPPLATNEVDDESAGAVSAWIASLVP